MFRPENESFAPSYARPDVATVAVNDYHELRESFAWDDYWEMRDWDARSAVNVGHEVIDRRAGSDEVAMHRRGVDGTEETRTFGTWCASQTGSRTSSTTSAWSARSGCSPTSRASRSTTRSSWGR